MVVRDREQRVADARHAIAHAGEAWVATASAAGRPHLVPLDVVLHGPTLLCATVATSPTARNLAETGWARIGVGDPADVVLIDATAVVTAWAHADEKATRAFVAQRGWDPGGEQPAYVLVELRPTRVQAWNSVEEIAGRTVMRDGAWLEG